MTRYYWFILTPLNGIMSGIRRQMRGKRLALYRCSVENIVRLSDRHIFSQTPQHVYFMVAKYENDMTNSIFHRWKLDVSTFHGIRPYISHRM